LAGEVGLEPTKKVALPSTAL